MICRELLDSESCAASIVSATGFIHTIDFDDIAKRGKLQNFTVGAFSDDGELMSKAEACDFKTNFYGEYVPTLAVGGVVTRPEFRRSGGVRACFEYLFAHAAEHG